MYSSRIECEKESTLFTKQKNLGSSNQFGENFASDFIFQTRKLMNLELIDRTHI